MNSKDIYQIFDFGRKGFGMFCAFRPNTKIHNIITEDDRKALIFDLENWKYRLLNTLPPPQMLSNYTHLFGKNILVNYEIYQTDSDPENILLWMDPEWYEYFTNVRRSIFNKYRF